MNPNLVFLKLPPIPSDIGSVLFDLCQQIKCNESRLQRFINIYSAESDRYQLAAQEYDTEMVPAIPDDVLTETRKLYSDVFKGGVLITIGMAESPNGLPSVTPPHCDRNRRVAINYLLNLGGDDVVTTFYHQTRKTNDLSRGENLLYQHVTELETHRIPSKQWHAFDPQRYHSVENITERRYYVSLIPTYNFPYQTLLTEYQHICQSP